MEKADFNNAANIINPKKDIVRKVKPTVSSSTADNIKSKSARKSKSSNKDASRNSKKKDTISF